MPRAAKLVAGNLAQLPSGKWRYRVNVEPRRCSAETFAAESRERAITIANGLYATWATDLRDRQRARAEGRPVGKRFSEVLAEYEVDLRRKRSVKTGEHRRAGTLRTYDHSLRRIERWFVEREGDPAIDRIGPQQVKSYLDWTLGHRSARNHDPKKPRAERTVGRDYVLLRDIFEHAADMEYTARRNPVTKKLRPVPAMTRLPVILTDAEIQQLLDGAGPNEQLRTFIRLQDEVGARPGSETMWLRWDDVDLDQRVITFRDDPEGHRLKTRASARALPITPALADQLRHYRDWCLDRGVDSVWVFAQWGQNAMPKGERVHSLQTALKRLVRAALPKDRPPSCEKDSGQLWRLRGHDFRHRAARRLKNANHPMHLIREFLGHGNPSVTDHYAGRADTETLRSLLPG